MHDPEVMGSNLSLLDLGMHSPFELEFYKTVKLYNMDEHRDFRS